MKEKIFLTSAIAMGVIAPAVAEPSHTGTFPSNGLMQADYTYTNAATAANMDSVYEGTVNATAEYETLNYLLSAGQYLPADSETPTTCPAGSFCSGIGSVQYKQDLAQGIETCPTGYASSAAGSSSNTQCYRTCDIDNMGDSITAIAHATAISGNDYYGSGTDTCVPTACENGWHVKAGTTAPNLNNIIGEVEGDGYTSNDSNGDDYDTDNMDNTIIANDPLAFAVDYGDKGIIKGHGRCSTRNVANPWYNQDGYTFESDHFVSSLTDETGEDGAQYCYCQLDSYTPDGGTLQSLSSPWVFDDDYGDADDCASSCAYFCAYDLQRASPYYLAFRAAVLGSVGASPAMCEANTIEIHWSDAETADITANNAGVATYGEDVRTPVKAKTYKGKSFKGWRFSKPEQTTTE